MKKIILSAIILCSACLVGCQTSRPIKTTLDLTTAPSPALNYSSEKDVIYSRTSTDPKTGIVEQVDFKALASAAAYAQAERDAIQAQANASAYAALGSSVQALGAIAGQVLNPAITPVATEASASGDATITRARSGPLIPATVTD